MDQSFARRLAQDIVSNPEDFQKFLKSVYFKRTGIISFSETSKSFNLWKQKRQQSDNNVVCVGIDEDLLKKHLKDSPNIVLKNVHYSDSTPKYELQDDFNGYEHFSQLIDIAFRIKRKFGDEQEIRILRLVDDDSPNANERSINLPNEIFKEIRLYVVLCG